MSGTQAHTNSQVAQSQVPPEIADVVDEQVDLSQTVWIHNTERGDVYHGNCRFGCACPEHIKNVEEATLLVAATRDLRPCPQCNPVDYRRAMTDGGSDVDDEDVEDDRDAWKERLHQDREFEDDGDDRSGHSKAVLEQLKMAERNGNLPDGDGS